jgi:hypothetical protein
MSSKIKTLEDEIKTKTLLYSNQQLMSKVTQFSQFNLQAP